MLVVYSESAVKDRFNADAGAVLQAITDLGTCMDVSGMAPVQIRARINQHPQDVPACLIGGYELLPTFSFDNPTLAVGDHDLDVFSDAPYGARPDSVAEYYLPSRAVSRLPDSGLADAAGFIALLRSAKSASERQTPPKSFEIAAAEFEGAAGQVSAAIPASSELHLSPPIEKGAAPPLGPLVANSGRLHILLHGADRGARRDLLWGRGALPGDELVAAVHASDFGTFKLEGAVVSFSSCYSATLEHLGGETARTPGNQVALACLSAGAKVVYGCTRANWIDTLAPFDSFATALAAAIWTELRAGKPVAEALRGAKLAYATSTLDALRQTDDGWSVPYVFKTLLQTHCYGHPMATL